jgi:dehydrogenase/reductase SDR family protein 7B
MDTYRNKVVWITGASSGIGEALSYACANEGALLVLSARRTDELERVKNNCANPASVQLLILDLNNADELQAKVEWVIQTMGSIDILINNAGISQRSIGVDTSFEVYRKIMEINFFGTIQLTKLVLPHFIKNNKGQFVTISSVAGKIGLPLRTAYSASKFALEGFFSALRTEIYQTNIQILIVRPGAVKTNIAINALLGDGTSFNNKDKMIDNGILPETVAASILQAIKQNKKELIVSSAKEKLLLLINRFIPGAVFNIVKKITP